MTPKKKPDPKKPAPRRAAPKKTTPKKTAPRKATPRKAAPTKAVVSDSTTSRDMTELRQQYGCGGIEFVGTDNALYERHLVFDHAVEPAAASPREQFEAFARTVRDVLSQ